MYSLQAPDSKIQFFTIVQQVVSNVCANNLIETEKSSKYDCACSHPEYQLVELKSGHQCVRPFLGFYTFDEAQMICNFDRSSILAPNDLEDAETFLDLASNGNDIWLHLNTSRLTTMIWGIGRIINQIKWQLFFI